MFLPTFLADTNIISSYNLAVPITRQMNWIRMPYKVDGLATWRLRNSEHPVFVLAMNLPWHIFSYYSWMLLVPITSLLCGLKVGRVVIYVRVHAYIN